MASASAGLLLQQYTESRKKRTRSVGIAVPRHEIGWRPVEGEVRDLVPVLAGLRRIDAVLDAQFRQLKNAKDPPVCYVTAGGLLTPPFL